MYAYKGPLSNQDARHSPDQARACPQGTRLILPLQPCIEAHLLHESRGGANARLPVPLDIVSPDAIAARI
jgi:hypothetical protein